MGVRRDPTNDRLVRFLKQAVAQFNAVNPSRAKFNFLAYASHKVGTLYADLHEALTGYFFASDGQRIPTMRPPAEVSEVDLYLWFEGTTVEPKLLFNDLDSERIQRVCALLDLDRDSIQLAY